MRSKKVEFILENLSEKERDEFLEEILEKHLSGKNITETIISWEATAEINSLPHIKIKILDRSKKLKHFLLKTKHAQQHTMAN